MMNEFRNHMRQVAQTVPQGQGRTRIGVVTSYDLDAYSVKVKLQPENVETGWLSVTSAWIGDGWGFFTPPTPGDMCEVEFQEGGLSAGIVIGRFWNDSERPLSVPSGELWAVHKNGQIFKLLNNGQAIFSDGHGATIQLNGDGTITSSATTWNHTGNFNVAGTVTASTDVIGSGKSLKSHVHTGVIAGGSNTGAPA